MKIGKLPVNWQFNGFTEKSEFLSILFYDIDMYTVFSYCTHPLNFYRSVFWKMKGSKHCSFTFNQIFTSIDISSCRKPNFCWQLTISQNFSKRGNFLIKWPTMSQHCGSRFRENLNFVCVQGRDVMHLCSIHSIEK